MKTAVIMQRDLNGLAVRQNSKSNMFNANDLLRAYNLTTSGKQKTIDTFLSNKKTKEYAAVIAADISVDESTTQESGELKSMVLQTHEGRVNGGTWMHPYLFIDFAMWLSPEFKLTCVKWIYDRLIVVRNDAGDSFKEVASALRDLDLVRPHYYINETHLLNRLVFGTPEGGQRNIATEQQLALMDTLQKADVRLIREGKNYLQREQALIRLKQLVG